MLYVRYVCEEACPPDKPRVYAICPDTAIHFILSGKGRFNGQVLGAGSGFITYNGEMVDYMQDPDDPWRYVWFRLSGTDSEHLFEGSVFPAHSSSFVLGLPPLLRETAALLSENPWRDLGDEPLLGEAVAKLLFSFFQKPKEKKSDGYTYVECAKRHMHDRLQSSVSMEKLANDLHISRKYLSNLFTKYEGVSPKQYLSRLRLDRAKELLISTDCPITVVAGSVGYEDVLTFSRFFRTHMGISPSQYRARNALPGQKHSGKP